MILKALRRKEYKVIILIMVLVILYVIYTNFMIEGFESSLDSFKEDVKVGNKLVLFYADWCGHCKSMMKDWDEASKVVGGGMIKINVGNGTDKDRDIMNEYMVEGFPTIIIFNNGKKVGVFKDRDRDSFEKFFN